MLATGAPKRTDKYTGEDLRDVGYVGIYEMFPCECTSCKRGQKATKFYKALWDWRDMNKRVIREREEKERN